MSAGQIAALIAAGAFVVLVLLLAVPLLKPLFCYRKNNSFELLI